MRQSLSANIILHVQFHPLPIFEDMTGTYVIILYFSVLLPVVSILLRIVYMNCMVFTDM